MVFITDEDYIIIKNVNKTVVDKNRKSAGEIIGEKCYRISYGKDEPFSECLISYLLYTMEAVYRRSLTIRIRRNVPDISLSCL